MVSFDDLDLGVCLVIGGSGWTGSFLIHRLIALSKFTNGISNRDPIVVHSIDIHSPDTNLQPLHVGDTFHHCDITNYIAIKELMRTIKPQTVFHLASIVDLRIHPTETLDKVNVQGTYNVINSLKEMSNDGVTRFLVYTSSIDVVSHVEGVKGATEDTPYVDANPSNGYKRTKIIAEKAVLVANSSNLITCALRPGHIYGPADSIMHFIASTPFVVGPKSARMSFIYVDNCAAAHILAAVSLQKDLRNAKLSGKMSSISGRPFFISDFDTNFHDFYKILSGRPIPSLRIPRIALLIVIICAEVIDHIAFYLAGLRLQHPISGITRSALEACDHLTAVPDKANEAFCYGKSDIIKLVSRDESIRRTRLWFETNRVELG